ncbi:hypothetical protein [Bifidobacterium aesculapii]|uniref:hypothetical protein n=1 Tax=Bifidobacterium aesculapii TaxID=1329411 RepID=UPI0006E2FCAB|nr:hypothetical protein [Bifidobacterium aesculapii]
MAEININEQAAQEPEEAVASDVRAAGAVASDHASPDAPACPVKRRCPMLKLFAVGGAGNGEPADCKANVVAGIVSLAATTALVVVSSYAQYVLTKWAVKAALKETRLR